ncbi:MAG TPA: FtsX-like permease family protein [Tepidisphaeraceae bacterium]|jgi:predicted lysophospholipase L1 biosynthesis ABC-type transport system permease subunit
MSDVPTQPGTVQRQIVLPLSKAVEIAWKSIRLRLSRSLLVTSGIVLALAFLVSIQASEAIVRGMRGWVESAESTARPESNPTEQERQQLVSAQQLQALMNTHGVPTSPEEIASNRIQTRWLLGLALLVAFVGILNSMLMSVTERFREIGTMKCLGALDGFIVKLFLIESLFQGVVGTVIGVALGLALSLAAAATTYGSYAFRNLPVGQLVSAIGISLVVGIGLTVAGAVYPAWQAARMQPIEAMRVET